MKDIYYCKNCKKEIVDKYRKRIYCSRSCFAIKIHSGRKASKLWKSIELYKNEYEKGMTFKEISEKYNVSKYVLPVIFRKAGFKIRKIGVRNGHIPWNKGKENNKFKGSNNPNWKGGITPVKVKIRRCFKYKQWSKKCMERDNWTCVICDKRGGELNVDHYPIMFCDLLSIYKIKSFEDALNCEELWNLNNGRTLCIKCHRKTFKFKGNQFIQIS